MMIHFKYSLLLLFILVLFSCSGGEQEVVISGRTMGTIYQVKAIASPDHDVDALKTQIDQRLQEINKSMSTYDPQSEISRFNQLTDTTTVFAISNDFRNVLIISKRLYNLTNGAWDGTVNPLVNLWGFGSAETERKVPPVAEIDSLLLQIGFDQIVILAEGIRKKTVMVSLDFGSIAKGYGVDQVAQLLQNKGIENCLVDIGGEVYARGMKNENTTWKVGINRPAKNAPYDDVYLALQLQNLAIATSGDYRNFFQEEDKYYSHIIDPRTGYPIQNGVVSASAIAPTCTFADGLATALMVMGVEKGLEIVNQLDGVECMMIVSDADQTLTNHYSSGFEGYVIQ